jgi:hypothetical protein
VIGGPVALHAGKDPERHREDDCDEDGGDDQVDARRDPRADDVPHGRLLDDGVAEVERDRVAQERAELLGDRAVEAEASSTRATFSGLALMPSISRTGLPGISRMSRNETRSTPRSTGML